MKENSQSTPKGAPIRRDSGGLQVPDQPIIPFIIGDGTGPDIWAAASRVFDRAVELAYGGSRKLAWMEVLAGQKAFDETGEWLPEATVDAFREYLVGIKGPLTTPVGGGIRSLNVALRQQLDLYVCLRPVRWYSGVPSPVKRPMDVDMIIFRENTEDIYAGIEFEAGSADNEKFLRLLKDNFPERFEKIRFPKTSGIGLKPISEEGTKRLVRAAIDYGLAKKRKSLTLVHKGNIMKYTEGAFRSWGYELADQEYAEQTFSWSRYDEIVAKKGKAAADAALVAAEEAGLLIVKEAIADIALQQVLTRPKEFDLIATMNLNGDYLSDALAAQVGGIGIAPGGNVNDLTGHALFEATHGTAPKYAGQDKVNPGSVILSGEMMLRHLGWDEAADLIVEGMDGAIAAGTVTYDFARLREDATEVKCSEFADAVIVHMGKRAQAAS